MWFRREPWKLAIFIYCCTLVGCWWIDSVSLLHSLYVRDVFVCLCLSFVHAPFKLVLRSRWAFSVDRNICVHLHLYPFIRSITLFRAANKYNNSFLDFVFPFFDSLLFQLLLFQSVWFSYNILWFNFSLGQTIQTRATTRSARIKWIAFMCVCTRCGGEKEYFFPKKSQSGTNYYNYFVFGIFEHHSSQNFEIHCQLSMM